MIGSHGAVQIADKHSLANVCCCASYQTFYSSGSKSCRLLERLYLHSHSCCGARSRVMEGVVNFRSKELSAKDASQCGPQDNLKH